jgi:hypothetical protein
MGCGKQLEALSFRKALRLGRHKIKVYLHGSKKAEYVWSNYHMSREIPVPSQKMPKVGHHSVPKGER